MLLLLPFDGVSEVSVSMGGHEKSVPNSAKGPRITVGWAVMGSIKKRNNHQRPIQATSVPNRSRVSQNTGGEGSPCLASPLIYLHTNPGTYLQSSIHGTLIGLHRARGTGWTADLRRGSDLIMLMKKLTDVGRSGKAGCQTVAHQLKPLADPPCGHLRAT